MAKNNYIQVSEAETGISSIEISAKAIAAAHRNKRKNILFASSVVVGSLFGAISLFMSLDPQTVSEKNTRHVILENSGDYFNDWPEAATQATNKHKSAHSSSSQTKHTSHTKPAGLSPVVSEKSLLHLPEQKKEVSKGEVSYIRAELMEMHKVPFKQTADRHLLAVTMQTVPMVCVGNSGQPTKNFEWFVGIGFNPQLSNYEISKNGNKFDEHDGYTHTNYISNLKNQSKVFSYNAGLKGGFSYRHKWMVEASLGYQSFRYMDKQQNDGCYGIAGPVVNGPWVSSSALAANTYKYMNFSLQASRLYEFKNVGVKTGISFSASRLMSANTVVADGQQMFSMKKRLRGQPLSKWIYTPGLHIGLVKNLSDRVQMQASPNLYYNLNSMFNRNYIVSQKPYGVGLDLSLMIRIN